MAIPEQPPLLNPTKNREAGDRQRHGHRHNHQPTARNKNLLAVEKRPGLVEKPMNIESQNRKDQTSVERKRRLGCHSKTLT
jgi:hypothetical protein